MGYLVYFLRYSLITIVPVGLLFILLRPVVSQWLTDMRASFVDMLLTSVIFLTLLLITDTFQPLDLNALAFCGVVILTADFSRMFIALRRFSYITLYVTEHSK